MKVTAPGGIAGAESAPADLVLMAHVREPFGLTGRVKLHVYSDQLAALAAFKTWWLAGPDGRPAWIKVVPEECVERGGSVVAKLPGVDDRDRAFARKGWQIAVPRSEFPSDQDDGFYWSDLVGLIVSNRDGVVLGKVTDLMDLGPHHVLRVGDGGREVLIPFVAQYIDRVDIAGGAIVVDWGLDY